MQYKVIIEILFQRIIFLQLENVIFIMKIFVAKLGFYTKADDLVALFSKFGKVDSAKVIMDRDTNRSKCYGFVEMPNDAEAYAAIVELDDCIFQGSTIDVKKSKLGQVTYTI